jgi:hypothetical protein
MSKGKYHNLKRNPLVRFMRWVYKTFSALFQPKTRTPKYINPSPTSNNEYLDRQTHVEPLVLVEVEEEVIVDPLLLTVEEIFEQVKWQFSVAEIQEQASKLPTEPELVKAGSGWQSANNKPSHVTPLTGFVGLNGSTKNRLITVSELFEQVKWQIPTKIPTPVLELSGIPQPHDVSRN